MSKELLLILDLDETLIHATPQKLRDNYDFQVYHYFVYKRPGLASFLQECARHFKLAVWSSASDDYVRAIVQHIFPPEIALEFVWGRSRCTPFLQPEIDEKGFFNLDYSSKYEFAKRLKKVRRQGFRLEQVLIVDDTPAKVLHNYGNAIYIKPYTGEQLDGELLLLAPYLATLKHAANVRTIEKRYWHQPAD
ncbi:phosphoprotein phosphatase [Hymenobacter sp. HMF4947]|uniref:Phosphoprotein phosphatase n=1 Tax=Hymenobacter ginkgonis TaxID=2682976 RepID=A0A7K1TB61_9BACT|nr:HAD family hydrolase [Hymenobacter ginkgonis]MVN75638.1 phosphoprotein phosphatase [Hymenobacter ginkgonis]